MNEKITDLIYAARALCELMSDRQNILDQDDDIKDVVEDLETALDEVSGLEDSD